MATVVREKLRRKAARRLLRNRVGTMVVICVSIILTMKVLYLGFVLLSGNSNNSNSNRLSRSEEYLLRVLSSMPEGAEEILSGSLGLVEMNINQELWKRSRSRFRDDDDKNENENNNLYEGVTGYFCPVNFTAHKENPSSFPMFRDVLLESGDECNATNRIGMDLKLIVDVARNYDELVQLDHNYNNNHHHTTSSLLILPTINPLNLSGVVFHESRCGSTLVANTLVAMDPDRHRVYSESSPPLQALRSCGDHAANDIDNDNDNDNHNHNDNENDSSCSMDQSVSLFRDVVYMMSRSNDPIETRVFFKIQSIGTRNLNVFRKAFPNTPWIFVYREPVQVLMSQFSKGKSNAHCLFDRKRGPPPMTQKVIQEHGFGGGGGGGEDNNNRRHNKDNQKQQQHLDPEWFCAAHLATLTESALYNLEEQQQELLHHNNKANNNNNNNNHNHNHNNRMGSVVQYEDLPDVLYKDVIPYRWNIPILDPKKQIENILEVSGQYSKGRGNRAREWEQDSEQKEERATESIRNAAIDFLQQSYDSLQQHSEQAKKETIIVAAL